MARYNMSRLGRFSSLDPRGGSIGDPQSLNKYAYVGNNPSNFVDPTGQFLMGPRGTPGGPGTDPFNPFSPSGIGAVYFPNEEGHWVQIGWFMFGGGGGGDGFYGGSMDVSRLRGNALVALLNPDCSSLFGGFKNAVTSLFNSSYNRYVPGQANPFPDQISSQTWNNLVQRISMRPSIGASTFEYTDRPGGIIFFTGRFLAADPGFATSPDQWSQMTGFFHEQEHAANHDPSLNATIDASTASYAADHRKINERCKLPQVEQQSFTTTEGITPP